MFVQKVTSYTAVVVQSIISYTTVVVQSIISYTAVVVQSIIRPLNCKHACMCMVWLTISTVSWLDNKPLTKAMPLAPPLPQTSSMRAETRVGCSTTSNSPSSGWQSMTTPSRTLSLPHKRSTSMASSLQRWAWRIGQSCNKVGMAIDHMIRLAWQ